MQVWDSMSGKVNVTFDTHEDHINWCEFSPDGTKILSCSSDKTLKVLTTLLISRLISRLETHLETHLETYLETHTNIPIKTHLNSHLNS